MTRIKPYPGPLFDLQIGAIAVMQSGTRVKVWGHDGDDPNCFTGIELATGDASCMWDRAKIAEVIE